MSERETWKGENRAKRKRGWTEKEGSEGGEGKKGGETEKNGWMRGEREESMERKREGWMRRGEGKGGSMGGKKRQRNKKKSCHRLVGVVMFW